MNYPSIAHEILHFVVLHQRTDMKEIREHQSASRPKTPKVKVKFERIAYKRKKKC